MGKLRVARFWRGGGALALVARVKGGTEGMEVAPLQGVADLSHELEIEMEVVKGHEPEAEEFTGFEEVPEVGSTKGAAGGANAALFDGSLGVGMDCIAEIEGPVGGVGGAVAGDACGQDAVEHINAPGNHFDQLRRRSQAHGITCFGLGGIRFP